MRYQEQQRFTISEITNALETLEQLRYMQQRINALPGHGLINTRKAALEAFQSLLISNLAQIDIKTGKVTMSHSFNEKPQWVKMLVEDEHFN